MAKKEEFELIYDSDRKELKEKLIKWAEKGKTLRIEVVGQGKSSQLNSFFHVCIRWLRIKEFYHKCLFWTSNGAKVFVKESICPELFIVAENGLQYNKSWADLDEADAVKATDYLIKYGEAQGYDMPDSMRYKIDRLYADKVRREAVAGVRYIEQEILSQAKRAIAEEKGVN